MVENITEVLDDIYLFIFYGLSRFFEISIPILFVIGVILFIVNMIFVVIYMVYMILT